MKKTSTPHDGASFFSEEMLVNFIESVGRMFKIGIYYPVGHVVLDQAAGKCIQQLREISISVHSVAIVVARNTLLVENIPLPETEVVVKELHQFLSNLGIKSVHLARNTTDKQFLHFVKSLLDWRSQLETAQTFIGFNVAELPESIQIEQQEFLVDENLIHDGESGDDPRQNLDELYSALAEQGLNVTQVEQCKDLLEKLSQPKKGKTVEIKGFPNATWQDVQALLYKIVTGTYSAEEKRFEPAVQGDISAITSIFESLENTFADKKTRETIELLVSHLTGRKEDAPEKTKKDSAPVKKKPQRAQSGKTVSVEELNNFIYENNIPITILERLTSVDRSEEMSILLQLIHPGQNQKLVEDIELRIEKILTTILSPGEKDVLIGGIKYFADSGDLEYFKRLLILVLQTFRNADELDSLGFVVELWTRMPFDMHLLLWPYVINELILVGKGIREESFIEATEVASYLHADGMNSLRYRLEELQAFREKSVAPIIFSPSQIKSYKLFATLLDTTLGEVIAKKVLASLQEDTQDMFIAPVAPLLDPANATHFDFLRSYLMHAHLKEPPLALKMAGGQIILEYLQNISEEAKSLPWLCNSIAATSGMKIKGMKEMLEQIVKKKKMGMIPAWPKNCRKEADNVLKGLKKRSLNKLL